MRKPTALVKICRVCGDRALGFNFNGLCCESCKSFFRRNALREEKYTCTNNGNCTIDCVTRKCCTKCRLEKCFAIGMNKELLNAKLERRFSDENDNENEDKNETAESSTSKTESILDFQIRNTVTVCDGNLLPNSQYKMSVPRQLIYTVELNLYEFERIKELTDATNLATFYSEANFQLSGEVTTLIQALNCAELYIKKLVKLCKNISAFKCLNVDDQLWILKCVFTEMLVICFSHSCRPEVDGFPVIEDENRRSALLIKTAILREAYPQNVVYFCKENIIRFHAEMENDPIIRDLLIAQRLFQPRQKLSCPEFMKYHYTSYNRLLQRYLEHKYKNVCKAQAKTERLTEMLSEMNPVKDILEGMFIACDSSQLALVLHQVFNSR